MNKMVFLLVSFFVFGQLLVASNNSIGLGYDKSVLAESNVSENLVCSVSDSDMQIIFGDEKASIIALSPTEMKAIQGAGWGKFVNKVKGYVSNPINQILAVAKIVSFIYPPTAVVSVPFIYTGYGWSF